MTDGSAAPSARIPQENTKIYSRLVIDEAFQKSNANEVHLLIKCVRSDTHTHTPSDTRTHLHRQWSARSELFARSADVTLERNEQRFFTPSHFSIERTLPRNIHYHYVCMSPSGRVRFFFLASALLGWEKMSRELPNKTKQNTYKTRAGAACCCCCCWMHVNHPPRDILNASSTSTRIVTDVMNRTN